MGRWYLRPGAGRNEGSARRRLRETRAEEITRIPPRRLRRIAEQPRQPRIERGHARGVGILDRLADVVAGLVVAVAQEFALGEPGHRCRIGALADAGGGG